MTSTPSKSTGKTTVKDRAPDKNIISVASGKGGVGKTWFSITLAHALAKQGKKVLLFDGDLGLANVDVQLGLMVKHDINDVIEGNLSVERIIHHYADGGFDIVAGRSGQGSLASLPPQHLNAIVQELYKLASDYDAVIMDLGAGVDKIVRFFASAAGTTLLVCTDEPTSLTDAYAFIKLSHASGHADTIEVVVNMSQSDKEGEKTYETLSKASQKFLKFTPQLAGIIHHEKRVKEAIRAQSPFLTRSPGTPAAQDVEKIATRVMERILR